MIDDLDHVYYGPEPWAGMWRNRHQLLSRLARSGRIVYIEPRPYLRDVVRSGGAAPPAAAGGLEALAPNLWCYRTPDYAAIGGGPLLGALTRRVRRRHLRQALGEIGITRPVVWLSHPGQADARQDVPARLRVYHVVDEYLAYAGMTPGLHRWLARCEADAIAWADLVIAVTPELVAAKGGAAGKARLLPNAADLTAFDAALARPADPGLPRPVLGYAGLISARLDLPALAELAAARPDWSLLMVGQVAAAGCEEELARLTALPNVHLPGLRPAADIPALIAGWDVGLIPYRVNEETRHASPLKLYEYLAAGIPVVSADVPAVRPYAGVVEIASGAAEMLAAIERALDGDTAQARLARWALVRQDSWDARVETLSQMLAEALARLEQTDERHNH